MQGPATWVSILERAEISHPDILSSQNARVRYCFFRMIQTFESTVFFHISKQKAALFVDSSPIARFTKQMTIIRTPGLVSPQREHLGISMWNGEIEVTIVLCLNDMPQLISISDLSTRDLQVKILTQQIEYESTGNGFCDTCYVVRWSMWHLLRPGIYIWRHGLDSVN